MNFEIHQLLYLMDVKLIFLIFDAAQLSDTTGK